MLNLKIWQIIFTYVAFLAMGLCQTGIGPSLLHLEYLLDTDTKHMGVCFFVASVGFMIGAFLCAVVFDRLNNDLQLSLMCTLMAVFTAALPWMPSLIPFIAILGLHALSMGFFEPAADSYAIARCTNAKKRKPVVTGLHATWSVGATLTPIILSPFLIDLPSNKPDIRADNSTANTSNSDNMTSAWSNTNFSETTNNDLAGLTNIRYGFMILGASAILPAIFYAISAVQTANHISKSESKSEHRVNSDSASQTSTNVALLVLLCLNYFVFIWYMVIPSSYLTAFTVKGLGWSSSTGSLSMSIYWGSHALSRLIGIPASYVLPPSVMVLMNISLSLCGFVLMFFVQYSSHHISVYLMWTSIVLIGLGLGTTFSTMILWASQYMKMTGRVTAVLTISASFGALLCNPTVGYILDKYSYMWLVYVCFLASLLHLIIFSLLLVLVKIHCFRPVHEDLVLTYVDGNDKAVELQPLDSKVLPP